MRAWSARAAHSAKPVTKMEHQKNEQAREQARENSGMAAASWLMQELPEASWHPAPTGRNLIETVSRRAVLKSRFASRNPPIQFLGKLERRRRRRERKTTTATDRSQGFSKPREVPGHILQPGSQLGGPGASPRLASFLGFQSLVWPWVYYLPLAPWDAAPHTPACSGTCPQTLLPLLRNQQSNSRGAPGQTLQHHRETPAHEAQLQGIRWSSPQGAPPQKKRQGCS